MGLSSVLPWVSHQFCLGLDAPCVSHRELLNQWRFSQVYVLAFHRITMVSLRGSHRTPYETLHRLQVCGLSRIFHEIVMRS